MKKALFKGVLLFVTFLFGVNSNAQCPIIPNDPIANPAVFNFCSGATTAMITAETTTGGPGSIASPNQAGGNGCGGGVMFDITNTSAYDITVNSFDVRLQAANPPMTVYTKPGTYVGSEQVAANWTLLGNYTTSGAAQAFDNVDVDDFVVSAGTTLGIYLEYNSSYTNITSPQVASNSELTLTLGVGLCSSFGGVNQGRGFNGTVHYTSAVPTGAIWYDALTGGNVLGTTNPFETIGTSVLPTATAGSYDFYVSSGVAGCESVNRTLVTVNINPVNVDLDSIDVSCNNGNDGSFSVANVGCGVAPFTFSVDGGSFGPIPTNLTVGSHTVIVKDFNNNQSAQYTIDVGNASPPSALNATNITATSALLSWTANGSETSWNVEWGLPGFAPGTGAQIGTSLATTNPTTITIAPNSSLEYYVMAECGTSTPGSWEGPYWFSNDYCAFTITSTSPQHITGFSTSGAIVDINNPNSGPGTTSTGYSNFSSMIMQAYETQLIDFNLTTSNTSTYGILVYVDWNNNYVFDNSELVYTSNGYTSAPFNGSFTIPTGQALGNYRMRVVADYLNGGSACSGNSAEAEDYTIEVIAPPTCLPPQNINTVNLSSTSATIGWTEINSATSWNIEYGPAGFTPGTPAGTLDNGVLTNPYTFTVTPNSDYEFYVQSVCSPTDESAWSGPYWFSNDYCAYTITSTSPQYINSFITTGAIVDINNPNSGPGTTTVGYSDFSSIVLEAYETQIIDFDLETSNTSTYGVSIYIDINNDFVFDPAERIFYSGGYVSQPSSGSVTIPAGTPVGNYRMRVIADYLGSNPGPCSGSSAEAEDYTVNIITPPNCLPPMTISASNIATNSIELSWVELNSATSWNIEYGPSGYTQGSPAGTPVPANSNPYTVTGLNPSANYDFYVQSVCSSSDSSAWRGPFSVYTACGIAVAPFYEGFNSGVQPQCWDNLSSDISTSINNFWLFNNQGDYEAANNGRPAGTFTKSDGSTPNPDSMMLITPEIDISQLTSPYLSFEWYSNNGDYPGDNNPFIIELFDGATWHLLDTLKGDSPDWEFVNYDLSAYSNNIIQVRFMVNQTLTTNYSYYNDILLDEVRIDDCISLGGQDGSFDVCRFDNTVNLEDNIIVKPNGGGKWSFPGQPAYLVNDTMFNVQYLPAGSYEVYYVERAVCYDTTVATINVFGPSSAGTDGTIEVCKNEPVNLYGVLGGNVDLGGTWYDYTNTATSNSQPKAPAIPGQYNFTYIVTNGVCPADTAIIQVDVINSCDFLSIGEEEFAEISVYPNPATSQLNIVNPSNTSSLKVEMLDMNGRIVLVENKALNNASEATLVIEHLERGVYTLRVYNNDGQKTFKIVKQ